MNGLGDMPLPKFEPYTSISTKGSRTLVPRRVPAATARVPDQNEVPGGVAGDHLHYGAQERRFGDGTHFLTDGQFITGLGSLRDQ